MNLKIKIIIVGMSFLMTCAKTSAQGFRAQASEPLELVATVFRLAKNGGWVNDNARKYAAQIDSTFGQYAQSPAVLYAKKMALERSLNCDAVASYAVYLEIHGGHIRINPQYDASNITVTDDRWTDVYIKDFTRLLDKFYRKTQFHKFFVTHKRMYDMAAARFTEQSAKMFNAKCFNEFFGNYGLQDYTVCINMLAYGNYSATVNLKDGSNKVFSIHGPSATCDDGTPSFNLSDGVVIHEYGHAFCNPCMKACWPQIADVAESSYKFVTSELQAQAYHTASSMMYETLVRAWECMYIKLNAGNDDDGTDLLCKLHRERLSFPLVEDVFNGLCEYQARRDLYPDLMSYMPRMAERINKLKPDSVINSFMERCPEMSVEGIADGDTAVAPGKKEIKLCFSIPHKYGCGINGGRNDPEGNEIPDITSQRFESGNTGNMIFEIDLKPDTKYSMSFPGMFYLTKDYYPCRNTVFLDFKTRK